MRLFAFLKLSWNFSFYPGGGDLLWSKFSLGMKEYDFVITGTGSGEVGDLLTLSLSKNLEGLNCYILSPSDSLNDI